MAAVILKMMNLDVQFRIIGLPAENADEIAQLVATTLEETADEMGVSLLALDGVTIAVDYPKALAELDRGVPGLRPLTATATSTASGAGMTPAVLRDGKLMAHIVLPAGLVYCVRQLNKDGVSGRYAIAHEAVHVWEQEERDRLIPNTILRVTPHTRTEDIIFYNHAECCWVEYIACVVSARIYPAQTPLYETVAVSVLQGLTEQVRKVKREWEQDQDYTKAVNGISQLAGGVLKYFSYLLGHADGLSKPLGEVAPEAEALLNGNMSWVAPHITHLNAVLRDMRGTFGTWNSLGAFKPLEDVARDFMADCGARLERNRLDELRAFIDRGKIPI